MGGSGGGSWGWEGAEHKASRTQCFPPPASKHLFQKPAWDGSCTLHGRKPRVELGKQIPDSLLSGILCRAGLPGKEEMLWLSPQH